MNNRNKWLIRFRMLLCLFMLSAVLGACSKETPEKTSDQNIEDSKIEDNTVEKEEEKEPLTADEIRNIILIEANDIIKALENKYMELLSTYIHPEKGLQFSPYAYVAKDRLTFNREQMKTFLDDKTVYTWGIADASGEPIELTTREYLERVVYTKDYSKSKEIVYNQNQERGNMKKNITEIYPNSVNVEYYDPGTAEFEGMNWSSLIFVFDEHSDGEWYMIAIIKDLWTQ